MLKARMTAEQIQLREGLEPTLVANKIAQGQISAGIAGGVDTVSDAPIAVSEGLRTALLSANSAKDQAGRLKALSSIQP